MAKEAALESNVPDSTQPILGVDGSMFKLPKPAKALGTDSAVLEASYQRFIADVFERDIRTVTRVEDATHRRIVVAGGYRLSVNTRTGLMSSEKVARGLCGAEIWAPISHDTIGRLLGSQKEWTEIIAFGWTARFRLHVPAADECFEERVPADICSGGSPQDWLNMAVMRAVGRRLGGKASQMQGARALAKNLWGFLLNRDIAKLTLRYFGKSASVRDYNLTARRNVELVARRLETPNLTILLGQYIKQDPKLRTGRYKLPLDLVARARDRFFGSGRDVAAQAHLSPAAWRYLAASSSSTVQIIVGHLQREAEDGPKIICALSLLAGANERVPHSFAVWLTRSMAEMTLVTPGAQKESLQRFVRLAGAAANHAARTKSLLRFIRGDLILAWDWLMRSATIVMPEQRNVLQQHLDVVAHVQKNATWPSLMRAQRQWHAGRAAQAAILVAADDAYWVRRRAEEDAVTWHSKEVPAAIGKFQLQPLSTGRELRIEGETMNHCVGGYVASCKAGTSRIFRLTCGTEVATVEIVEASKTRWRARQVFGRGNETSSEAMWHAAKQIARLYSKSPPQQAAP